MKIKLLPEIWRETTRIAVKSFRVRHGFKVFFLTLLLLSGKWFMVEHFAGQAPYGDQWEAEGEEIYIPILHGDWSWDRLFTAWNEHRIVPTRLLAALLFTATGHQWDPTVELAVSALVHSLWLGLAAGWLMCRTRAIWHWGICGFVIAMSLLPFTYENTLWAFQDQFYFLLLFSTLAGWGLLGGRTGGIQWWIGLASGILAVFSMGSGGGTGGAILVVLTVRGLKQGRVKPAFLWTALVAAGLLVAMWMIRVEVPRHAAFAAGSLSNFWLALGRLLAWPFSAYLFMLLVVWMPFGVFLIRFLNARTVRLGPLAEATLYMAAWVVIQMMALAWVRGNSLIFSAPPSRYMDILSAGLGANFLAILTFCSSTNCRPHGRLLALAWTVTVGVGLTSLSVKTATHTLELWKESVRFEQDQLELILRTGEDAALKDLKQRDLGVEWIKSWTGPLAASLPPALQARPPQGFGFSPDPNWSEGGFDPHLPPPGGYAVWGSWLAENKAVKRANVIKSAPFLLTRDAVAFSYAMSSDPGQCNVEFVLSNGETPVAFSVLKASDHDREWREASLRLPPGLYRMRVRDLREGGWFAITSPREMSGVGFTVRRWLRQCDWLFCVAGLGLILALVREHSAGPVGKKAATRSSGVKR